MKFLDDGTFANPLKSSRYFPFYSLGVAEVIFIMFFWDFVSICFDSIGFLGSRLARGSIFLVSRSLKL